MASPLFSRKLGLALAAIHLILVFAIYTQHFEGSWGGFFLFVIDFPFSLIILFLSKLLNGWIAFAILGSLWWYALGMFMIWAYRKLRTLIARHLPNIREP
jgi:hypothetical protein